MCGNIKKLRFPDRPASRDEIEAAVLQYVRKLSNVRKPSAENEAVFDEARASMARSVQTLLDGLKARRAAAVKIALFRPV